MWIFIRVYLPASKINYKNIAKNNRKILSESKFDKSNPLSHRKINFDCAPRLKVTIYIKWECLLFSAINIILTDIWKSI